MNRRVKILGQWIRRRRYGVTLPQLVRFLASPTCRSTAGKYIESIAAVEGNCIAVHIRGLARPLYWPIDAGIHALHMFVGETLHATDWHYYEVPETRVRNDDIVVDCGAAEGLFALTVEQRARHVYVIEPSPQWIPILERTFAGLSTVTILPFAVGRAPGIAYLSTGVLDSVVVGAAHRSAQRIRIETIDRLFYEHGRPVTYLKADLEGFELDMLSGAERTIASNLPRLAITTYHQPHHATEIARFLRSISSRYRTRTKGIEPGGAPMMLHAWTEA